MEHTVHYMCYDDTEDAIKYFIPHHLFYSQGLGNQPVNVARHLAGICLQSQQVWVKRNTEA